MDLSNLSSNLPFVRSLEQVSLADLNKDLTTEFKNTAKTVVSLYNSASQPENGEKNLKTEFADAAKAVAALYRTGNNSNVLLMHKGYLDCLDDLLQIITSGEDIENWVLTKRAELTNLYNSNSNRGTPTEKEKAEKLAPETAMVSDLMGQNTLDGERAGLPRKVTNDKILPNDKVPEPKPVANSGDQDVARASLLGEHQFSLPEELMSHLMFRPSFPPLSVTYKKTKRRPDLKSRMPISLQNAGTSSDYDSDEVNTDIEARKKKRSHVMHDAPKRRKRGSGSDNDGLY